MSVSRKCRGCGDAILHPRRHIGDIRFLFPEPCRLIRLDRRPAKLAGEEPARRQCSISDHLGGKPQPWPSTEQGVIGISREKLRRSLRRLPVSRRGHNLPPQVLHVPARVDEVTRQPVEQLGMRGQLSLAAEVFGRDDDSPAEDRLPPAIDGHPRRERLLGSVSQRASPSRFRGQSAAKGRRAAGVFRVTGSPGASYAPRRKTKA